MDAAAPRSSLLRFFGAAVLVAGAVAWAWEVYTCGSMAVTIRPGPADRHERLLPYDRGNPVFFDNDFANDYVDWCLMAAASAGELRYRGDQHDILGRAVQSHPAQGLLPRAVCRRPRQDRADRPALRARQRPQSCGWPPPDTSSSPDREGPKIPGPWTLAREPSLAR